MLLFFNKLWFLTVSTLQSRPSCVRPIYRVFFVCGVPLMFVFPEFHFLLYFSNCNIVQFKYTVKIT